MAEVKAGTSQIRVDLLHGGFAAGMRIGHCRGPAVVVHLLATFAFLGRKGITGHHASHQGRSPDA